MWWKVTGVIPTRPREFVLTPRKCISGEPGNYKISLRENLIKGMQRKKTYRLKDDYRISTYPVPDKLAEEILWYIQETEYDETVMLDTLFRTEIHYSKWERVAPYTSRYYTYNNLATCLRYFYREIVIFRYGYVFVGDRGEKYLQDREIQMLTLGDTRHLSLINMLAEGATPMVAMMLAGHTNIDITAHYYSNITRLLECKTYRQYKATLTGKEQYSISGPISPLKVGDYVSIGNEGRCYSNTFRNGIFDDCKKTAGPAGEIGYCKSCTYYRSNKPFAKDHDQYKKRILTECTTLNEVVRKVRAEKGDFEEIILSYCKK